MVSQDTPDEALGGTELYVLRLSKALLARGVDVSWVHYSEGDPALGRHERANDPIQYYRIFAGPRLESREDAWRIDPIGLGHFREVLQDMRPDCVHFHGFGRNQSPEHFEAAKQVGAAVLMTWHAPGQSCVRWDLLHKNREMCSGKIDVSRCTDCALHRAGVPAPARAVFARLDLSPLSRFLPYSAQHPFVRRRGMIDYKRRWAKGMAVPDKILWHAEWVRDLLLRNGISEDRLHRLPLPPPRAPVESSGNGHVVSSARRFAYIGRLIDIKGVHIITEALRFLPQGANIDIRIVGARGPEEYLRGVASVCAKDPRLRLVPPVAFDEIPALMRDVDAVIVPSLWPETGPYTVLEALWVGTPVIGSDRAGIRETLKCWEGGVLFQPGNAGQLARLLVECDLPSLRRDVARFRTSYESSFNAQLTALFEVVEKGTQPNSSVALRPPC
jgi:glycosyltransferase involved in cell wall biosynthesis